jgi:DNA excision repair protein ERCC-4
MIWGQAQLEFHKQIVTELFAEDGLVILAEGLGLLPFVVAPFIRIYAAPEEDLPVIILGFSARDERTLSEELAISQSKNGLQQPLLFRTIHSDTPANKRRHIYAQGGVISVTPRILLLDILNKRIVPEKIAGFLVYHAHRVVETSTEAFILRLFRQGNKVRYLEATL